MTGANYTGGKRNIARTRFRDSTRRVQKNHFGRRRLGILSRGLANGTQHPAEEEAACGISGILLEHAQREISRPPISAAPVHQTAGARGAFTLYSSSSSTGTSTTDPNVEPLDNGSYSSLRAEVNRILEFSRTVGLCNYLTSPRQGAPASLGSRLDSELGQLDLLQQRNDNYMSPMSGPSGRQHPKACTGYAAQDSEVLEMSQTQSYLLGEVASRSEQAHESEIDLVHAEPTSNYEYLEYCDPETPAQPTCILETLPGEDKGSLRVLENSLYPTGPLSSSFDALEFPTSPLPPSSPFLSSTTYGSLLSLCPISHGAETLLDFDKIPLSSTVNGSCEVGSSSRHGGSRHITPDLASASPLRHLPRSGPAPKVCTVFPTHSKADLIPDLLTCDDPWNVIGNMLDLPPIPSADATYFNRIRSNRTLLHEHVSSPASSSSLGQVRIEEDFSVREEGTRLRALHSDGDLLNRPDPSSLGFSHKTSRRPSSLLLYRDSPKKVLSPARPSHPIYETRLSRSAGSHSPSPSPTSGKIPVLSDAPQSLLEPHALPASPGPLHGTSGMGWENSSALVKTLSPCILTSQRPTSSSPENLNSLKNSLSCFSGILSSHRNTKFDPVELIAKVSPTQITASKAQRPKLECPDLFQDEDSLGDTF